MRSIVPVFLFILFPLFAEGMLESEARAEVTPPEDPPPVSGPALDGADWTLPEGGEQPQGFHSGDTEDPVAGSEDAGTPQAGDVDTAPFIYGAERPAREGTKPTSTMIERGFTLMGYLLMVGAIMVASLWFFRNNPRFRSSNRSSSRCIRLSETHPLGQKRFLTIVECDGERILLGISPGRMDYLCQLPSGGNDELASGDSQNKHESTMTGGFKVEGNPR